MVCGESTELASVAVAEPVPVAEGDTDVESEAPPLVAEAVAEVGSPDPVTGSTTDDESPDVTAETLDTIVLPPVVMVVLSQVRVG